MKQEEVVKWAITLIVLYLLYKLIKGFTKLVSGGDFPEVTEDLESELIDLRNRGINPTISESDASSYAEFIYETNLSFNTDENEIFNIFRVLNNKADLVLLKIKFGTRRPLWGTSAVGLSAFLKTDLNESEIKTINDILAQKNIGAI